MLWAIFKHGDAAAACKRYSCLTGGCESPGCDIFVSGLRDGQSLTAISEKFESAGLMTKTQAAAFVHSANLVFMEGKPDLCASLSKSNDAESCREKASLLAALRSADAQACAASPLCTALTSKDAAACSPYLKSANKIFCGAASKLAADEAEAQSKVAALAAKKPVGPAAPSAGRIKALKEAAAKREAILKIVAAANAQQKLLNEERMRQAEALRKKMAPPKTAPLKQYHPHERKQILPPDVMKRMKEIEKETQAAPAAPTTPQ
jgi:hypothetical protein